MKTKILLADDEEDLEDLFRQLFDQQIQDNLYEFIFVRNGLEALAALEQQPDIAILISDINMPGMDGLTLLKKLPTDNPTLRTIILTAYGDMSNIRTAMNRGAFDFLTKPVNFQDLEATLDKTIRSVNEQREVLELRAMDAMKTRFFVNITHEFRSPLTLIVGLLDKLLSTLNLPASYQQPLIAVQRNVRQLLRLINELLDIHKLEAGHMDIASDVGDFPGFIEQLVDMFRPSADIKQLSLTYQANIPTGYFLFDARKWEKIVYNLLSNAIKFTETGGVVVSVNVTTTAAQLEISDTGIGIAPHKLPYIFNRFYQAGSPNSRSYEGTGIGLALVQELTTRLGGTIQVISHLGGTGESHGSRFVVDIPIQPVDGNSSINQAVRPQVAVDQPILIDEVTQLISLEDSTPLVVLVEDNTELRAFLLAELAKFYRVRSAANGQAGWVLVKEELPDVVISDLMMPVMDGYQLMERIRTDPETDHIAIVLLTTSAEEGTRLKGLTYGADGFLTKPFNVAELHLRLHNLLNRQKKLQDAYRQQFAQPNTNALQPLQNQFLGKLYSLLDDHLADSSMSVDSLASHLAMSRKAVYSKVRALTNLSPNELIRQYRLRRAIALLKAGYSASETAYRVGFESPSYFTKVFKEYYQQTPTDYLKL